MSSVEIKGRDEVSSAPLVDETESVIPQIGNFCVVNFFARKIIGLNNFCKIEQPARIYVINYSQWEYFVRLIFVLLHEYENIPTAKFFQFTVMCWIHICAVFLLQCGKIGVLIAQPLQKPGLCC